MPENRFVLRVVPLPAVLISPAAYRWSLCMLFAAVFCLASLRRYPDCAPLHHDIFFPLLALELPHTPGDLRTTLDPVLPVERAADKQPEARTRADFLLSATAELLLLLSSCAFFRSTWDDLRPPSRWPMRDLLFVTAAASIVSALLLYQVLITPLTGFTPHQILLLRFFSTVKWAGLVAVTFFFGVSLTRVELRPLHRAGTGMLALLLFLAALVGFTGLNSDIPFSPWQPGWFSHRHLETFATLTFVLPVLALAAGAFGQTSPTPSPVPGPESTTDDQG